MTWSGFHQNKWRILLLSMGHRSWFSHRLGEVEGQFFKSLIMGNWSQFTSGDKSWYHFLVSCTVCPYNFEHLVVLHSFIMALFFFFLEYLMYLLILTCWKFLRKLFSPDWGFLKEQLQLHSPTIVSSLKEGRQSLKTTDIQYLLSKCIWKWLYQFRTQTQEPTKEMQDFSL